MDIVQNWSKICGRNSERSFHSLFSFNKKSQGQPGLWWNYLQSSSALECMWVRVDWWVCRSNGTRLLKRQFKTYVRCSDIKLYQHIYGHVKIGGHERKTLQQLQTDVNYKSLSCDIDMKFSIVVCFTLNVKRENKVASSKIASCLRDKPWENQRTVGIFELGDIFHTEIKETLEETHLGRIKVILKSHRNVKILTTTEKVLGSCKGHVCACVRSVRSRLHWRRNINAE